MFFLKLLLSNIKLNSSISFQETTQMNPAILPSVDTALVTFARHYRVYFVFSIYSVSSTNMFYKIFKPQTSFFLYILSNIKSKFSRSSVQIVRVVLIPTPVSQRPPNMHQSIDNLYNKNRTLLLCTRVLYTCMKAMDLLLYKQPVSMNGKYLCNLRNIVVCSC